uniref:Secreted venom family 2 protein n=1 Tax=Pristhesancus plagipennis TaxID=1955184 RepID=A0A2K8JVG0_PRIPG|nr:secreted venom family 2 protein [Pristhesancus plagipennis]
MCYFIVLLFLGNLVFAHTKFIQIDQLTPQELEILGKISNRGKKSSFLSNFQTPECSCEDYTCVCCLKFSLSDVQREICLDAGFNKGDMKANVELTFDREEIFTYSLRVTKVCANLPAPLSKVEICIDAYKVDVKEMPSSGMFCMKAELSLFIPFLSIDFNCVKWEHQKLTLLPNDDDNDNEEENNTDGKTAMVNVDVNGGRMELTYDTPIPPELVQQIKDLSQRVAATIASNNKQYAELVKKEPDKYGSEAYKWNLLMNIWKNSIA